MRTTGSIPIVLAVLLAACSAGSSPSPAPPDDQALPSRAPLPSGEPSSIPSAMPDEAGLSLIVSPPEDPPEVRTAIPGQRVCFLVVVSDQVRSDDPATVEATAEGATIEAITPVELLPGVVGEVWIVPDPTTSETIASITITAERDGTTLAETRSLPIFPMVDERGADAQPHFERWVAWLAAEHPELGITPDTEWDPEFVSTLLVVSHYAYWSAEWEMAIAWHNMIAPYDWSEVYLRHRGTESAPSLAFKIDSVSGATEPYSIEPPAVVVR